MRKSRVAQWSRFTETWLVQTPQGNLIVRGWDEALFIAQLFADPHEYIRAAREAAYREGNCVGTKRGFVLAHGIAEDEPPNPYRKDQS